MSALYTTLVIALLSALIATLIGTAAAIGIQGMKRKSRTIAMGITNIPMLNADIVTGISLMLLFIAVGSGLKYLGINFSLGFATVLIAHITFNIPYVILSVMPKLKQTKRSTYEAALDLAHLRFTPFLKLYFRIFCRACSQDFCWHLPSLVRFCSSPTLQKVRVSIRYQPKFTVKSAKESNRKCMHFPLCCLCPC